MTSTSDILTGLAATVDDLDAARTSTDQAVDHALNVKDSVLAAGWSGIAQGMQEVADRLEDVLTAIGQAVDRTGEATQYLGQIDGRMSPAEVGTHLSGTLGQLDQAHAAVTSALDDLDGAQTTIAQVLDGGDPAPLLGMTTAAGQRLATARQQLDQAHDAVQDQHERSTHAGN